MKNARHAGIGPTMRRQVCGRLVGTRARWAAVLAGCVSTLGALPLACSAPTTAFDGGVDGGAITDALHAVEVHRAVATPCSTSRPPGTPTYFPVEGGCKSDLDCADGGINGRCNGVYSPVATLTTNTCSYDTCFADDACANSACLCREDFPRFGNMPDFCATGGNCRIDSDCPQGQLCSPSAAPGCADPAWYCHTPNDTCHTDSDCTGSSGQFCAFSQGRWMCIGYCLDG